MVAAGTGNVAVAVTAEYGGVGPAATRVEEAETSVKIWSAIDIGIAAICVHHAPAVAREVREPVDGCCLETQGNAIFSHARSIHKDEDVFVHWSVQLAADGGSLHATLVVAWQAFLADSISIYRFEVYSENGLENSYELIYFLQSTSYHEMNSQTRRRRSYMSERPSVRAHKNVFLVWGTSQ